MRLNLGRRLCWCATCLQSKVKVRKTHKSSLLRKRSEFTLRPAKRPIIVEAVIDFLKLKRKGQRHSPITARASAFYPSHRLT